jgi:hypothetical protein
MAIADEVEEYVEARPYVQEALVHDIVNFSALARQIEGEVDGGFEAVKMALRRLADDIRERRGRQAESVAEVLAGTSIELRNNVVVCKTDMPYEAIISAKTHHGYTLVKDVNSDQQGEVIPDQVLLTLKSRRDLEETPGVLAYMLSLFAGRQINVTELISCREDTHIVVHEDDATAAFELLNEKLQ